MQAVHTPLHAHAAVACANAGQRMRLRSLPLSWLRANTRLVSCILARPVGRVPLRLLSPRSSSRSSERPTAGTTRRDRRWSVCHPAGHCWRHGLADGHNRCCPLLLPQHCADLIDARCWVETSCAQINIPRAGNGPDRPCPIRDSPHTRHWLCASRQHVTCCHSAPAAPANSR